jgi:hypothetical protein
MALFGHGAMSDLSPLSGAKRKSDFGAVRSAFDPGCVKTCRSQECAELFSLSSSLSSGRKHFWFSNLRNRDGISTRRLNVGVFTRPRPGTEVGVLQHISSDRPSGDYAAPFALGATCYVQRWGFGWNIGDAEDETEARRLTRRALELDRDDPLVLALAGQALGLFIGEVQEGAALLARAISLEPMSRRRSLAHISALSGADGAASTAEDRS